MDTIPLEEAIQAATQAAALTLDYYERGAYSVQEKADRSPVTSADLASHDLLRAKLSPLGDLPVLSEEDPVPYETRRAWRRFWLVDPLDGTKDFIERTGDFTVNVALIDDGVPVLGIVAVPAQRLLYYAAAGQGAFLLHEGRRTRIHCAVGRQPLVCAVSRFHCSEATKEFCRRNGITEMQAYGSALKLCKIAEGGVDVYPRLSPTMEWDIAAGQCIVQEAGGCVYGVSSGAELRYNKESLVNDEFIAARSDLHFS